MAKEYFEKLTQLVAELKIADEVEPSLEVKHFFSGAALYANQTLCASWSPSGLAFKLPESEVADLIVIGEAKPLKYFAKRHIKKGYALFENPGEQDSNQWKMYFVKAVEQV